MSKYHPAAEAVRFTALVLFLHVFLAADVLSQVPPLPALNSRSAVLYDLDTGALLYEKNGSEQIPPASMTKLMVLRLVYKEIEAGRLGKDEYVPVGPNADFRNAPPRSSLMFIEEGQSVTVLELMAGLAVPSGNDAAVALAERISGTVDEFVALMNREARELGLESVRFADTSGYSSENSVTAMDFGRFCLVYLREHPESLEELHSLPEFTYPKPENILPGTRPVHGGITQRNRNILIGRHPWVTGIKTGYIMQSGYNVALSAEKGDRRLAAVLMGGAGDTPQEGDLLRALDGIELLSYGFYRFVNRKLLTPYGTAARVWKGDQNNVNAHTKNEVMVTLPLEFSSDIRHAISFNNPLIAPVARGEIIGEIFFYAGERRINSYPLYAAEPVGESGFLKRILDSIRLFFSGITFLRSPFGNAARLLI